MSEKPILGITMGDPSGNGPEISVKACMDPSLYERCRPLIVGDAVCMEAALKLIEGAGKLIIHPVSSVKDALFTYGTIDVYDMGVVDISKRLYQKDRETLSQCLHRSWRKRTVSARPCAVNARFNMCER